MARDKLPNICIVGGGIAGLSLARQLQAEAIPFQLFERRRVSDDAGFAINLPGNAIAALARMGLRDQVEAAGRPIKRREYRTASDKLLFEVDEDGFWGAERRPRSLRRSELLALLERGLDERRLNREAEITRIVPASGHLQLHLADGTQLNPRLVVGADGVRSVVRQQAFAGKAAREPALLARSSWRFMVPNPGVDCWTVWAGPQVMVLLMPVTGGEVYGWAAVTGGSAIGEDASVLERVTANLPARVRRAVSHALSRPETMHHSPLEEVRMRRWHRPGSVVIGDAAHATAPIWAQGAALAMEDACVLARSIAGVDDLATALTVFENERRRRVDHVQNETDSMSRAARMPSFVRNALLPFVGPRRYARTYGPLRQDC